MERNRYLGQGGLNIDTRGIVQIEKAQENWEEIVLVFRWLIKDNIQIEGAQKAHR